MACLTFFGGRGGLYIYFIYPHRKVTLDSEPLIGCAISRDGRSQPLY